jgi:hypothetical protein
LHRSLIITFVGSGARIARSQQLEPEQGGFHHPRKWNAGFDTALTLHLVGHAQTAFEREGSTRAAVICVNQTKSDMLNPVFSTNERHGTPDMEGA